MIHPVRLLVLSALVAGCATFPELDTAERSAAARVDYPKLVPLGPLLARAGSDDRIDAALPDTLAARAAALRARAALLRGSPITAAERTRLRNAGQRNAARLAGG
ncbi:hypothetical protein [Oceaniglobus indicus]|uniref:hypothetical protein n=1 Tax=Oceaniglobus indicus TaxID=2047749 RepID=UPI001F4DA3ED|nr:hypothetical protein [Oceaniglobus indicus]